MTLDHDIVFSYRPPNRHIAANWVSWKCPYISVHEIFSLLLSEFGKVKIWITRFTACKTMCLNSRRYGLVCRDVLLSPLVILFLTHQMKILNAHSNSNRCLQ